jgi:undecaprenyl-diphosphatase
MNPLLLVATTFGDKIDSTFYAFDMWVYSFFGGIQCGFLTIVAKMFTSFGDEAFVIPMAIFAIVLCFFKKTRKYGFALLFAIAIGTIVTNVLVKPMVLRIRPYNTLQGNADYWAWYIGAGALSESDYSFPSGHTTAAFEMAVSMFLCFRSEGKKIIAWVPLAVAVCTMGSRVYLMVHYATDVIGGLIVGTVAGVCAYFLSKLACAIFSKVKFLDAIDVEKLFKKGISSKVSIAVIGVVIVVLFCVAFVPSLSEGGDDAIRCAYNQEYDCQNEAKVDDEKYPAIDGENYCKIHWKQLSGVE